MSLLTSFLVGGDAFDDSRYGVWKMSGNYLVPVNTQVGLSTNRFPFDTLLSGSFADFNTTTHKLTVTKKGIYLLAWDGSLVTIDTFGGTVRRPAIRITTASLVAPTLFTNQSAVNVDAVFTSSYGISRTTFLDVGNVVEFGFEYKGSSGLGFSSLTALQIILLDLL